MNLTWEGDEPPGPMSIGILGWVRIILRGLLIVATIAAGLAILLPLRLIERPVHGMFRPWTPHITRIACRLSLL